MGYLQLLLISGLLGFSQAFIDQELMSHLNSGELLDILINFQGGNSRAIKSIEGRSFKSRLSKVKALTSALRSARDSSQGPLEEYLKSEGVEYETFWSSNQMAIRSADLNLVQHIDSFQEVSRVEEIPPVELFQSGESESESSPANLTYGLKMIKADSAWANFSIDGRGVVVANIDTGVRWTHEALRHNFRGDHAWFDPYTNSSEPIDENGHGTHVMGTIAGSYGVGVAPNATWIACRGCDSSSCDSISLMKCGEWMLSPTNPDGSDPQPSMIPDVIANSWGSLFGNSDWYNKTIAAWTAADILHAFAIGNSGPFCRSGGSPGDQPGAFAVGSTDWEDKVSIFSSKGPAFVMENCTLPLIPIQVERPRWYTKPDIAAPGSEIRSAWFTSDTDYKDLDGTSMACPHVAGVMALLVQAHRKKNGRCNCQN